MQRLGSGILALHLALSPAVFAEVTLIDVEARGDLPGNREYGLAGAYEKLSGKIYFEIDPDDPANQIITDIEHAPVNAAGHVEFSADFYTLSSLQTFTCSNPGTCGAPTAPCSLAHQIVAASGY
jgi:hypothetical protein